MTRIDFYINSENRLATLATLSSKAMRQSTRLFVLTEGQEDTEKVGRYLWTQPATGFLPHCRAAGKRASVTPIIVDHVAEPVVHEQVLVNFSTDCSHVFSRFERLIEIVGIDEDEKLAARGRFRFYRDRGYEIRTHDLAKAV
jgi:DNA polymerase III subunit chi